MTGNRKDHIRVWKPRKRKTKSDITPPPSNRRVPRRTTSKGEGGVGALEASKTWRTGQVVPFRDPWRLRGLRRPRRIRGIPAAMAEQGARRHGGLGCHGGSGIRRPWRSTVLGRPWRSRELGMPPWGEQEA